MNDFIDLILHTDEKLLDLVTNYGTYTYVILFAIIFCETGLVFFPFLPGDALLLQQVLWLQRVHLMCLF